MILPDDSRRRHPRMSIEAAVSLVELNTGARRDAVLSDLSSGGMSFQTDTAVAIGDELQVAIEPALKITPPLYARAVVLRCVPARGGYHVSVATRSMDSQPSIWAQQTQGTPPASSCPTRARGPFARR